MQEKMPSPERVEGIKEERKNNEERWKRKSEKHNQSFLRFVYGRKSPEYFMREEAGRTDADIERRAESEEFKKWEIMSQPTMEHSLAKRNDPEGEGKKYRILLMVWGGGMRALQSNAQMLALNMMGINKDCVDTVIASSGGAGPGISFLDTFPNFWKSSSIWYDECTDKNFFNILRVSRVMDSRHIGQAMRTGEKAVNTEEVINSNTKLFVITTRKDNGEIVFTDVKTATSKGKLDMISAIEATMNVPLFKGIGVEVNGVELHDGDIEPFPIAEAIKKFNPTDIIILPNVPFNNISEFKPSKIEKMASFLPEVGNLKTTKKFLQATKSLRRSIEAVREQTGVNFAMMWPPDCGITSTTTDPEEIKMAMRETIRATFDAFGEKQPDRIDLYEPKK